MNLISNWRTKLEHHRPGLPLDRAEFVSSYRREVKVELHSLKKAGLVKFKDRAVYYKIYHDIAKVIKDVTTAREVSEMEAYKVWSRFISNSVPDEFKVMILRIMPILPYLPPAEVADLLTGLFYNTTSVVKSV